MTGVSRPTVSVIMNIQNGEDYLRVAMDSVFAQDFDDWELIVWDSHSSDSSPDIVASYDDPRLRYIRAPDLTNLGRARQLALEQARGEWVAYLDQDDIWAPEKLGLQVGLGSSDPKVGLVYGRTLALYPSGKERDFNHRHEFQPLPEGDIFELLFHDACFIAMSSAMFRRSALTELGGVPQAITMIPDYFMILGVARRYMARATTEVICRYRWHDNNMTWRYYKPMHEQCIWLIDHFSESLDPKLAAYRRKVHQTNIAYKELQDPATLLAGLGRLVAKGSLPYFLSRPVAKTTRAVRRRVQQPYWLRTS